MSHVPELPILLWPISCFDRRRENPLPVYQRWYWLDWSRLTGEQTVEILAIVRAKKRQQSPHSPGGLDETVVTQSIGGTSFHTSMQRYRYLFTEIPDDDLEVFWNCPERRDRGFETISLTPDYLEDENGNRVTEYEMMQHVTGQEFPVIVGMPESMLRIGAVSANQLDQWTVERANLIAQFLDVVERIRTSTWYGSPKSITSLSRLAEGKSTLLEALIPSDSDTLSALAYFRQLHAADKLLSRACDTYVAHVGDARKQLWVSERKQAFESLIDSPPSPYDTDGKSRREIIRMFMYGAGLLHSSSNHGDDVALAEFIAKHRQHEALMIFNSCLMDFYRTAATIYPVIRQDFRHWIDTQGLTPPSRITIPDLFRGFRSPPHGGQPNADHYH